MNVSRGTLSVIIYLILIIKFLPLIYDCCIIYLRDNNVGTKSGSEDSSFNY